MVCAPPRWLGFHWIFDRLFFSCVCAIFLGFYLNQNFKNFTQKFDKPVESFPKTLTFNIIVNSLLLSSQTITMNLRSFPQHMGKLIHFNLLYFILFYFDCTLSLFILCFIVLPLKSSICFGLKVIKFFTVS